MRKRIAILLVIGLLAIGVVPVFAQGVWPAWQHSFERGTAGWITDDTSGQGGWCGEITQHERGSGPVAPSRGHGYAIVEHGPCNEFWTNRGWSQGSGPFAPFGGFSESWPQSGFVTDIDIYLDPGWADGTSFTYANSIRVLEPEEGSVPFRYFTVPVEKSSRTLMVNGHAVDEAGWYTFRLEYTEEDGHVAVDFQLADRGRVLFTDAVTTTAYSNEATSSLTATDFGTGYAWFVALSDGLELPIDHSKYRPGK